MTLRQERTNYQRPFEPLSGVGISVSSTPTTTALPDARFGSTMVVTNYGNAPAFVEFGSSSAGLTATTSSMCILPNAAYTLSRPGAALPEDNTRAAWVSVITSTGTTNLQIETGFGL
jgi:hypothetical protein